jgi:23S rRNA (adenine2503-C2)-methyltransferase
MGCRFCETGRMGLIRNLTAAEIVGQATAARNEAGRDIRNVVFMGMGEAFDNFDAVIQAVRVMNDPRGLDIAYRYITLSTAGLVEGIEKLAALHPFRPNLGVSLNAASDAVRSRLMPINEKHSMQRIRESLMAFPLKKYEKIMISYVLIDGFNNQPEDARKLAEYLAPLTAEVNVIAYNPVSERNFSPPGEAAADAFCKLLADNGIMARKRSARGRTILGACGQLGNRHLKNRAAG